MLWNLDAVTRWCYCYFRRHFKCRALWSLLSSNTECYMWVVVLFVLLLQCHVCEQVCSNAGQLRLHLRAHIAANKPFMCDECGQRFTRHGHLQRHMRLHTGDKPFMCNRCACQFARNDHLHRHLQAHLLEDSQPKLDKVDADDSEIGIDSAHISVISAGSSAGRYESSPENCKLEICTSLCSDSSSPSSCASNPSIVIGSEAVERFETPQKPSLVCRLSSRSLLGANLQASSKGLRIDSSRAHSAGPDDDDLWAQWDEHGSTSWWPFKLIFSNQWMFQGIDELLRIIH